MKIRINPIYRKEIMTRVRSFKFACYILGYNLILVLIALMGFELMFNARWNPYIDYSGASKVYFIIIGIETFMVVLLVPAFTAETIAGEREKQTMEILLTTVLKPMQIIRGKLFSSISMVVLLVFSSLPVISIVFTVGGINVSDILLFIAVITVISMYIGSMGIFASAALKKTVASTVVAYLLVILTVILPVVIIGMAYFLTNIYYYNQAPGSDILPDVSWTSVFLLINPCYTVVEMAARQYGDTSIAELVAVRLNGSLPHFLIQHWIVVSMVLQMFISMIFMKASSLFLKKV